MSSIHPIFEDILKQHGLADKNFTVVDRMGEQKILDDFGSEREAKIAILHLIHGCLLCNPRDYEGALEALDYQVHES